MPLFCEQFSQRAADRNNAPGRTYLLRVSRSRTMTKLTAARREQPSTREPDRRLKSESAGDPMKDSEETGAHGFLP